MNAYKLWELKHPQAATELKQLLGAIREAEHTDTPAKSEARAQQEARLSVARAGAKAWRNNNGATPSKIPVTCPKCGFNHNVKQTPIRYGLANDSQRLNSQIKSSDLILAIPRVITQTMVGTTIAQFGSVECKRPGWAYRGTEAEIAQLAWLQLIASLGGYATFSTGEVVL